MIQRLHSQWPRWPVPVQELQQPCGGAAGLLRGRRLLIDLNDCNQSQYVISVGLLARLAARELWGCVDQTENRRARSHTLRCISQQPWAAPPVQPLTPWANTPNAPIALHYELHRSEETRFITGWQACSCSWAAWSIGCVGERIHEGTKACSAAFFMSDRVLLTLVIRGRKCWRNSFVFGLFLMETTQPLRL